MKDMKKKEKSLNPTPENPQLFYCKTEMRNRFENEREKCFEEMHDIEPLKGKLFTETDEYFVLIEMDADDRGEVVL